MHMCSLDYASVMCIKCDVRTVSAGRIFSGLAGTLEEEAWVEAVEALGEESSRHL